MTADVIAGGRVYRAEVAAVESGADGKSEVRFKLIAELTAEPALPITLVMSVYKFDRMEWAIEKLTELGVAEIVPAVARRSEKHLAQAARSELRDGGASRMKRRSRREIGCSGDS